MVFALDICRAVLTSYVMIKHAACLPHLMNQIRILGQDKTTKKGLGRDQGYRMEASIILNYVALFGLFPL